MRCHTGYLMLIIAGPVLCQAQANRYCWLKGATPERTMASGIGVPAGFRRTAVPGGSFADWLRHLPLKAPDAPVLLYNGKQKANQQAHAAVLDIDTGTRNLQQCADAVIRLRAEYLFSRGLHEAIHFNFTSGHRASYVKWAAGFRPVVKGNRVTWTKRAAEDRSYAGFRAYLDTVFTYAGTLSLSREMQPRPRVVRVESGDVFIRGGSPGHAVLVVDMAEHVQTGEKVFLLAQGYMPAQDIHILKNPGEARMSPWYRIPSGPVLRTPEWAFDKTELKFFAPATDGDGQAGGTAG
jgi:hypothetical protein